HFVPAMDDISAALAEVLAPAVLFGGTAESVIGRGREVENAPALSVFGARLPGAQVTPVGLEVVESDGGQALMGWPQLATSPDALLLFADPFSFPIDGVLAELHGEIPGLLVIGGFASAASRPGGNRLLIDGSVTHVGAVGALLSGAN